MRTTRTLAATCPRRFGRARAFQLAAPAEAAADVSDDIKLFAANFAGGFVFVAVLIG